MARSVVTKFFFAFWLTLLVVEALIAWSIAEISQREIPHQYERSKQALAMQLDELATFLSRTGLESFSPGGVLAQAGGELDFYLLGQDGKEAFGKIVPEIIVRSSDQLNPLNLAEDSSQIIGQRAVEIGGKTYSLVALPQRPHPLGILISIQHVLLWILISALIGFLLARYLATPLNRLTQAVRALAVGDFSSDSATKVTQRQDQIGDLAREFNGMAKQVQAVLASQRTLLRDISHELRSPLARMHVAVELVRSKTDGAVTGEVSRIEQEIERLNDLIGEVLAIAKLESSTVPLARDKVELTSLLASVVEDARFESRVKNTDVIFEPAGRCNFVGDAEYLRRAFENIVRNAVQHTPAGSHVEVVCRLEQAKKRFFVSIADNGPGVPESKVNSLFKPFFRVDDARASHRDGFGLGLAIAEKAIIAHGGLVRARNRVPQGLLVEVELPAA